MPDVAVLPTRSPRTRAADARPTTLIDALAASIERQIREGTLAPGAKLPSLRALAQLHGHAKNTVVAAFERLVARGLVEPRRGSGYYVLDVATTQVPAAYEAGNLGRALDIVWLMREQLKSRPDHVAVGDGFPPVQWLADVRLDRYQAKVVRTGLGALFRYGSRFGYEPLRVRLVRKLADLGIGAEPDQIVLTHGANEALDIIVRYFVPPGGKVLVDDPGYYPLFGKLKLAGAQLLAVPRLPDGPDLVALADLLLAHRPFLFITQSVAHNPTGSDLAASKARKLLELARQHNLLIVENDPLADFKPTASTRLAALDQLERTLYVGSFSKSFSAALRVGFIACSADLASDLADLKALIHVSSSEYGERTVDVMLGEVGYERHLVRLRERLAQATARATSLLEGLGARILVRNTQTLYLWATLPGVRDSLRLARALLPQKVVMAPGRIFAVDPHAISAYSRFNVGTVVDPRFVQALEPALRGLHARR